MTMTRRDALQTAAGAGLLASLAPVAPAAGDDLPDPLPTTEVGRVMAAGMTEAEAECWELVAAAAGKFFELPELHPMDRQEVASAIHIVQNKLLSRPTYRRYLEIAKASRGER